MAVVFIGGLSEDTTEQQILDLFYNYRALRVKMPQGNGAAYAFVEVWGPDDADRAVAELDGATLNGRTVGVRYPRERVAG